MNMKPQEIRLSL